MTRITITQSRNIFRGSAEQYRLAAVDERHERMLSNRGGFSTGQSTNYNNLSNMLSKAKAKLHDVR